METKKFDELLNDVRQQLEDQEVDFVLVATNVEHDQPVEGLVVVSSKHGISYHADMLFQAAQNGEEAPQHFIERIIQRAINAIKQYLQNVMSDSPKNNNNAN